MATHSFHNLRVYRKRRHVLIIFLVIILPIVFIAVIGRVSQVSSYNLFLGLSVSLYRLVTAYVISLVTAIVLAVVLGHGKIGDFFVPVFDLLQNLPSFALIPVFVLLFGFNNTMAIVFAASSILWPILFYILNALRSAKTDFNEAAIIFGATGWKRVVYYFIPLSYSAIITGSIVGISIGWEAIIGVEIIGRFHSGIGIFLSNASLPAQTGYQSNETLFLGIAALLLVVFSINRLIWVPLLRKAQLYGE